MRVLLLLFQIVVQHYAQVPTPAFTMAATSRSVLLNWTASASIVDGYNVYRGTVSGGPYSKIGTLDAAPFTDLGVVSGSTYYYVTTAFNANGESIYSNESSATIPAGQQCVSLAWTSLPSATYNLYRGTASGGPYTKIGANLPSANFVDSGASHLTTYYYIVRPIVNGSETAASNEIVANIP